MSKMEFLRQYEAEKFKKQKCIQHCGTPCTYIKKEKVGYQTRNNPFYFATDVKIHVSGESECPPSLNYQYLHADFCFMGNIARIYMRDTKNH